MNLVSLLDVNARKFAGKSSLRYKGEATSFQQLKEKAEQAAGCLQKWGVSKGDRVAIMSYNTPAFVYSFFAVLKAGAIVVPINHKLQSDEVCYILAHSNTKVFLFDGELGDVVRKSDCKVTSVSIDSSAQGFARLENEMEKAKTFEAVPVKDDDIAEILYTSGTTGKPKGCLHTHRNVIFAAMTTALELKMDVTDKLLTAMPIWHSGPLNCLFIGALYMGATVVLMREYHPLGFLEIIQNEKCTVYFGAPISYLMPIESVPNFNNFDLSSMRVYIYGGGPISGTTALRLIEKYRTNNFYQIFAMTETGPSGTLLFPGDQIDKAGSVGCRAVAGSDLIVMKDTKNQAGPGETGEVWLKSDSMMNGYLDDVKATEKAFHNGWYRTGDMARIDEDGYLYIVDRIKDMIITGGENVYSKEVEDAIVMHPEILEAAVIGKPNRDWGETVVAKIVLNSGASMDQKEIQSFLFDKLAKYKIPREYEFVTELPRTPTGKVEKYKMRKQIQITA